MDTQLPKLPEAPELPSPTTAQYFYIVAHYGTKLVIIGPEPTEESANQLGLEKLDVPFDVIALPTRDRARATAMLKARDWRQSGNLSNALQRAHHKI